MSDVEIEEDEVDEVYEFEVLVVVVVLFVLELFVWWEVLVLFCINVVDFCFLCLVGIDLMW